MRHYVFLILLLASITATAQGVLTTAEVYDFQPGDVFETRFTSVSGGPTGPPGYMTDSILERYTSPSEDTLYYTILRSTYQPPAAPGQEPFNSTSTVTKSYWDLDQPATQYSLSDPCASPTHSLAPSSEYCDRDTWTEYAVVDTCFESVLWTSSLVRGCGGPYYTSFQPAGPLQLMADLIYFRKGEVECGGLVTGIDERIGAAKLRIHPNPGRTVVLVAGHTGASYELFDLLGKPVQQGRIFEGKIDLQGLPVGPYVLRVLDAENITSTVLMID